MSKPKLKNIYRNPKIFSTPKNKSLHCLEFNKNEQTGKTLENMIHNKEKSIESQN
jgi:hypothetical protein